MARRGTTGLFAAPVRPVTQQPSWAGDPADVEIADWIRKRKQVDIARQLENPSVPGQVPAAQPPVVTVQDQIALSKEAREASHDIAQAHREAAEAERSRRQEAEKRAADAYEAGQAEAENRAAVHLELFKEFASTTQAMLKESYEARLQAKDETHRAILERIDEKLNAALAAKEVEVARHRERAEELERQVRALSERETFDQVLAKAILGQAPEKVDLIRRLFGAGQSGELSPEQEANRRWMVGQVDRKLSAMDAEERRKDALHGEIVGLAGAARQVLTSLNLGALIPVPRRPDSAVPEWAEEVPPEAQAPGAQTPDEP
jgi:hypothetical protein